MPSSSGHGWAGLLWALATWMKWIPVVVWFILEPRARGWGLVWLAISIGLSLLLLPLTIIQFQALFEFGARPIRLDYLVFLWAFVPWWYRRDPERPWLPQGLDVRRPWIRRFIGLEP